MNFMERFENAEKSESGKFEKIPPGSYMATVSNVEIKEETFPEMLKISVEFALQDPTYQGRKAWWNTRLSDETSDKAMSFIKGQICRIANVESTNGDLVGTLNGAIGNNVNIDIDYKPGVKDPTKEYMQIFVG